MIRRLAASLAVAACFAMATYTEVGCGGVPATSPEPAVPTGDLAGTVTDAVTSAPIAAATVTVTPTVGVFSLRTDSQGRYAIFGIPASSIVFDVKAAGYRTVTEVVTIREGQNRKDVALQKN